jgi:hypothetical protein
MKRSTKVKVVLWLVISMLASFALIASAISPTNECELAGGTFTKVGGTQTCNFVETPGNNLGGVTKETDVSQKGSSRSSHPEDTRNCVDNSGGNHCPPGQQ